MNNDQGAVGVNPMDVISAYQKQLADAHHTIALLSARLAGLEGGSDSGMSVPPKSPGVERAELRWASDPDDSSARGHQVNLDEALSS